MTLRPREAPARGAALLPFLALPLLFAAACNPIYVSRVAWSQVGILSSREPIVEAMTDPATDDGTRGKLRFVWDARRFAIEELGFRSAGEAYTSVAQLPSDTLALVLSAAYRDRLAFRTWWFPIIGRIPYRAYFSESTAERARDRLEREGFDTYLRPTVAFSTLGWFDDPVYSSVLRQDAVGVVETILHELAHNHSFIPGQGRFNESWANFAGHAAAIEFFCRREGGGPDTVLCLRARDRWTDAMDVSRWLMALEVDIRAVYDSEALQATEKIARRDRIYAEAFEHFRSEVRPGLRATSYGAFAEAPLNNATLLARTLYYHRLNDFHRFLEAHDGDLRRVLERIREEAPGFDDPFSILDVLAPDSPPD